MDPEKLHFTKEQETTIRFQLLFGVGMTVVSLVCFWAAAQFMTVDLRFAFLFVAVILALIWFKDGLIMLSDVAITVMKMGEKR